MLTFKDEYTPMPLTQSQSLPRNVFWLINCIKKMTTSTSQNQTKISQPLIVICGCTGTGKSEIGIELAKNFNGEIINADSMQIYKGLDIVTNKVTMDEMQGIKHHLMNCYDPCKSDYQVHQYKADAIPIIERIWRDGKLPIIVGGTAYYIESVIYENNFIATNAKKSDSLRKDLLEKFPTNDLLYQELQRVDPLSAAEIHRNMKPRVLRALEVFYLTGQKRSDHIEKQRERSANHFVNWLRFKNTLLIAMDAEKKILNERLNNRVDKMLKKGLIEELGMFYNKNHANMGSFGIMQSIGLKEFTPFLELTEIERNSELGRKTQEKCIELIKLHTRQYTNAQRKWFYNRIFLRSKHREVPCSIVLNAFEDVIPVALKLVDHFLITAQISNLTISNSSVLMPLPNNELYDRPDYISDCRRLKYCDICKIESTVAHWDIHISGARHRKRALTMRNRKKLAEHSSPQLSSI